jgi:hypothetical protein
MEKLPSYIHNEGVVTEFYLTIAVQFPVTVSPWARWLVPVYPWFGTYAKRVTVTGVLLPHDGFVRVLRPTPGSLAAEQANV